MAKAQGIIGNFKGKVGNMVGYQLTDSNNKQTQGIRIYQPNVKNPKTSAQAEQRAKLAPINATYRSLKMIIDRGNEGLPYGNKSRLAWLKKAFKAQAMPWFVKGAIIDKPVVCELTRGSLPNLNFSVREEVIAIVANDVTGETPVATIGNVSTALLANYSFLKAGDQVTFIQANNGQNVLDFNVFSFVIDTTSTEATSLFKADEEEITYQSVGGGQFGAIIVSREGDGGEHLRSTTSLVAANGITTAAPYDATSKTAAIASYMAAAGSNSDWAEESID